MKIKKYKEIEVASARIEIQINPANGLTDMRLSYTCPACAGWGCGKHGSEKANQDCNGGTVNQIVEPSHLKDVLDETEVSNVYQAIAKLLGVTVGADPFGTYS